jgi:hypothetical protein
MGLGAPAAFKRHNVATIVASGGRDAPYLQRFRHFVKDMSAVLRAYHPDTSKGDVPTTPMELIKRWYFPSMLGSISEHTKSVTLCCDNHARNPRKRLAFYDEVRYKTTDAECKPGQIRHHEYQMNYKADEYPVDDAEYDQMGPDYVMPKNWNAVWNNKKIKPLLMTTLMECIKRVIEDGRYTVKGCVYKIDMPNGDVWVYPPVLRRPPEIKLDYGEGDLQVLRAALHAASSDTGPVCIVTIDWDQVLSALAFQDADIQVMIATVFLRPSDSLALPFSYNSTDVQLVKHCAEKKFGTDIFLSGFEFALTRAVGNKLGSFVRRLMFIQMILGRGGCDYCHGTNAYGFTEVQYRDLQAEVLVCKPWLRFEFDHDDPTRRIMIFEPTAFLAYLRVTRFSTKKANKNTVAAFAKEVLDQLWTLQYGIFWDAGRKRRAGPPIPDYENITVFPGAPDSVADLIIDGRFQFPPIEFVEEHPDPVIPFSAFFAYPVKQARAIEEVRGGHIPAVRWSPSPPLLDEESEESDEELQFEGVVVVP